MGKNLGAPNRILTSTRIAGLNSRLPEISENRNDGVHRLGMHIGRHARNVAKFGQREHFLDKKSAAAHFDAHRQNHVRSVLDQFSPQDQETAREIAKKVAQSPDAVNGPRLLQTILEMLQDHPNARRIAMATSVLVTLMFGSVSKPTSAEAAFGPAAAMNLVDEFGNPFEESSSVKIYDGYCVTDANLDGLNDDVYQCVENVQWDCVAINGLKNTLKAEFAPVVLDSNLFALIFDGLTWKFMKYDWDGSNISGEAEIAIPDDKFPSSNLTANNALGCLVYTGGFNDTLFYYFPDQTISETNPLEVLVVSAPTGGVELQDMVGATLSEDESTLYFGQLCSSPHGGMTCPSGIKIFAATWDEINWRWVSNATYNINLNPKNFNADPAFSWNNAEISMACATTDGGPYHAYLSVQVTTTTTTSTGFTTTTTTTITIPTTSTTSPSTTTTLPSTTTTLPSTTTTFPTVTTTTTTSPTGSTSTTTTLGTTTSSTQQSDDDTDDDPDDDSKPSDDDDDGGGGSSISCG